MQRFLVVIGLQAYAVVLAYMQYTIGLRTDEAKYLLNIPYPHPPVARGVLGLTDGLVGQELLWRIVFATLVVQVVWLVWNMFSQRSLVFRVGACVAWLTSAALMSQAGSVMMAPLTAVQALVFVWLTVRKRSPSQESAGVIGLFWLASLFTAYQAALFMPIVYGALKRTGISTKKMIILLFVPIALLALYTMYNPLSAASILVHTGDPAPAMTRMSDTSLIWMLAGSAVLSVLGTLGIVFSRSWTLIASFVLVCMYTFLEPHGYYAVLFLPLLIAGLRALPPAGRLLLFVYIIPVFSFLLLARSSPADHPANLLRPLIQEHVEEGMLLVTGKFGHEWQYGSWTVRGYHQSLIDEADAVVCMSACGEIAFPLTWQQVETGLDTGSTELWVPTAPSSL